MKGKVKWYSAKKGYGFIKCEDKRDVFVHRNDLPFWTIYLETGDKVEFEIVETKRGLQAINIKIL